MKLIQSVFLIAFIFLSSQIVSAQYSNNGYGGGYGGSNRMNTTMAPDRSHDNPKEIPVEETVAKFMLDLKPELALDELQEIAISNILIESFKSQTAIIKSKNSGDDDKIKELQVLSENTERRVNELLNSDQKEKYIIFTANQKNRKKSKKK